MANFPPYPYGGYQPMQMLQGKSPQEQQQMFLNMCKEHNIDPRQFAGQFGINLK